MQILAIKSHLSHAYLERLINKENFRYGAIPQLRKTLGGVGVGGLSKLLPSATDFREG